MCCNLSFAVSYGDADADLEGTAKSAVGTLHSRRPPAPHKITEAVSARDCRRDQLPRHLRETVPTEPMDFLMTTGYGYKPYNTRAFLSTFRRHNREARVVVLLAPDQVRPVAVAADAWHFLVVLPW